jgi:hypothetical protein
MDEILELVNSLGKMDEVLEEFSSQMDETLEELVNSFEKWTKYLRSQ